MKPAANLTRKLLLAALASAGAVAAVVAEVPIAQEPSATKAASASKFTGYRASEHPPHYDRRNRI